MDYLIDFRTLELWSGKILYERTKLFRRAFPTKSIAVTSLRKLYLKHGVKRKAVRMVKRLTEAKAEDFSVECGALEDEFEMTAEDGRKFIFLDEICWTKRSIATSE